MEWFKGDFIGLVYSLLPGFLAAWIFHAFTAHPKREPFDRVVQALIFTMLIRVAVIGIKPLMIWVGRNGHTFGPWTDDAFYAWSVGIAVPLGIAVARASNCDRIGWLRWLTGSKRTAYPSEWYSAFHKYDRWVVLHLKGERRLRGWPEEFPDASDKGHFLIHQPAWALANGEFIPLSQIAKILVPAVDVEMIEFEKDPNELTTSPEQIDELQKPLRALHEEKPNAERIIVP